MASTLHLLSLLLMLAWVTVAALSAELCNFYLPPPPPLPSVWIPLLYVAFSTVKIDRFVVLSVPDLCLCFVWRPLQFFPKKFQSKNTKDKKEAFP